MFKKVLITLALVSVLTLPAVTLAAAANDYGLGAAAPQDLKSSKLGTDIPTIVGSLVGVGLSLLGVIFFLLFLYAGFLWMTALGNEKKVDKAKDIMEAAGIGLMIVLAAYAITTFLFKNVGSGTAGTTTGVTANGTEVGCCTQTSGGIPSSFDNVPHTQCVNDGGSWVSGACTTSNNQIGCCTQSSGGISTGFPNVSQAQCGTDQGTWSSVNCP